MNSLDSSPIISTGLTETSPVPDASAPTPGPVSRLLRAAWAMQICAVAVAATGFAFLWRSTDGRLGVASVGDGYQNSFIAPAIALFVWAVLHVFTFFALAVRTARTLNQPDGDGIARVSKRQGVLLFITPIIGAVWSVRKITGATSSRATGAALALWWVMPVGWVMVVLRDGGYMGDIDDVRGYAVAFGVGAVFAGCATAAGMVTVSRLSPVPRLSVGPAWATAVVAVLAAGLVTFGPVRSSVNSEPIPNLAYEEFRRGLSYNLNTALTPAQTTCYTETSGLEPLDNLFGIERMGYLTDAEVRRAANAIDQCIGARHFEPWAYGWDAVLYAGDRLNPDGYHECIDGTYTGEFFVDYLQARNSAPEDDATIRMYRACLALSTEPVEATLPLLGEAVDAAVGEGTFELIQKDTYPVLENPATGTRVSGAEPFAGLVNASVMGIARDQLPLEVGSVDYRAIHAGIEVLLPTSGDIDIEGLLQPLTGGPASVTVDGFYKSCLMPKDEGLQFFWVVRTSYDCDML